MKELRRDVVRALGTIFFQYMPDELLSRLIANPPKTILELRDDFEMHAKIIENFGMRLLHVLSMGQQQSQPPHVNQPQANASQTSASRYFDGAEAAGMQMHCANEKSLRREPR